MIVFFKEFNHCIKNIQSKYYISDIMSLQNIILKR